MKLLARKLKIKSSDEPNSSELQMQMSTVRFVIGPPMGAWYLMMTLKTPQRLSVLEHLKELQKALEQQDIYTIVQRPPLSKVDTQYCRIRLNRYLLWRVRLIRWQRWIWVMLQLVSHRLAAIMIYLRNFLKVKT